MEKSYQRQFCSPLLSHLWNDTNCAKFTILSAVTLIALTCLALGAITLSGEGLNAISPTFSIAMVTVAGVLLASVMGSLNCQSKRICTKKGADLLERTPSEEEADLLQSKLRPNEFFVFKRAEKGRSINILRMNTPFDGVNLINDFPYFAYDTFKQQHREVSYQELQQR